MTITAKAREALEKAYALEHQQQYEKAKLYFTIASREKSAEGTRGVERMLRKLKDQDIIDSVGIIRDRRKDSVPLEKPKMTAPLSIPSEETRTLIEDRSKPQQKNKAQQEKQNKTAEKPRNEKAHGDNADELLKRAQESEVKGNKKEAFQLFRKAADYGSEIAKSKVGQRYLKLAVRYLGRQAAFEKLGEKIPPQQKDDKAKVSTAPKLHFLHQRNRIAELNGCGDMAETETSVLYAAKAEEKTWVGEEKKSSPPPPQVIIQEIVRYVAYWSGEGCMPTCVFGVWEDEESYGFSLQTGHEFCAESIIRQTDFAEISAREEETSRNEADVTSDVPTKDDVCELSWKHIFTLIYRKLFTIFRK